MRTDGGYPGGAQVGAGYCDAQWPDGGRIIRGKPNANHGPQCCNELDIWEANRMDTSMTSHICSLPTEGQMVGQYGCTGSECAGYQPAYCHGYDFSPLSAFFRSHSGGGGIDTMRWRHRHKAVVFCPTVDTMISLVVKGPPPCAVYKSL
jgi:hypothetical protein